MAFNLKNMTVDYKSLLKLTVRDRVNMAKSDDGMSWLAALTPSQLAELFPSYYRKQLPDLGKTFLSGGTKFTGPALGGRPAGGGSSLGNYQGTVPLGPVQKKEGSEAPSAKKDQPTVAKPSWKDRLENQSTTTQEQAPVSITNKTTISGSMTPNDKGKINPTEFRNSMITKLRSSKLIGVVPPDGAKYGIKKGTAEEWANYFTGLGYHESGLNVQKHGDKGKFGGHGSRGIFQLSPADAITYKLQKEPFSYEQIQDPDINSDAAIKIHEHWIVKRKKGIQYGAGQYWGPLINEGWTPGAGRDKNLPWSEWRNSAFTVATTPEQQDPNQTGSTGGTGIIEPKPTAPVPGKLPDGLHDDIKKHYESLPDEKSKSEFRRKLYGAIESKRETIESLNASAAEERIRQQPTATPYYESATEKGKITRAEDIRTLRGVNLQEKFPAGQQRFFREGGGTSGLNPKLVEALKEASKDLPPGYHVRMHSGVDAREKTKNHPGGVAIDLKIVDDKGKILRDRGFGEGHKIYEQLAQSMNIRGKQMFPGTRYIWGGAWKAARGDRMHYQIDDPDQPVRGASPGSRAYTFESGVKADRLWAGPSAASQFMTREELRDYQETISNRVAEEAKQRLAAQQEKKTQKPDGFTQATSMPVQDPKKTGSAGPVDFDYKRWADVNALRQSGQLGKLPIEQREEIFRHYHSQFKEAHDYARTNPESAQVSNNALSRLEMLKKDLNITPERQTALTTPKPLAERAMTFGAPKPQAEVAPAPTATPAPAEPPKETAKEIPEFEHGGEAQASGDNAYVIGETGKPLFKMNTERERMTYDPSANSLKVEPTHRTNTDTLQQRSIERQDRHEEYAESRENTVTPQQTNARQPVQQNNNHHWDKMMNSMIQSSANIYETASFHRAVAKSRFIEVGDSVKGGHYSYGASNLKWL